VTQPREAIIRVIDVEGEPLRLTALEQPVREGGYHNFVITNFPNLVIELAEAWARREWAKGKR